jgi:hypothetical protein
MDTSTTASSSSFSIASIPDDVVISRASTLGVSLGSTEAHVRSSIHHIKDLDLQRTLVMLQRNEDRVKKGDVNNSNLVLEQAIELSADLKEDEQLGLQGQKGLTSIVEKQKRTYKKKISEVSVATRTSARLKLKKRIQ